MGHNLIVEIFGEAKQFAKELDHAAGKTRQFGKVAGVAGLALAGGLVYGLEKSAHAAIEGQVSQNALDQALKTTHQSLTAMKPALDAAEESGRKLGFTDDETRASLARLELATHSTKAAVADLAVAQGLARTKNLDLATATNAMAMAMTGSQRAAKQLGIIIPPVTDAVQKLKDAGVDNSTALGRQELKLAAVTDKMATGQKVIAATSELVKGQAQAYADSAAGGMAQFHAQTLHLEETLGSTLIPAITAVTSRLATMASYLSQHTALAKILLVSLGALAGGLLAVSIATKVAAAAQAIMTAGQWALNVALDANPIGLIIIGLVALGAGLVVAYRRSQTFRDIVQGAMRVVVDAFDSVKAAVQKVAHVFEQIVPTVSAAATALGKAILDGILSGLRGLGGAVKNAIVAARQHRCPARADMVDGEPIPKA